MSTFSAHSGDSWHSAEEGWPTGELSPRDAAAPEVEGYEDPEGGHEAPHSVASEDSGDGRMHCLPLLSKDKNPFVGSAGKNAPRQRDLFPLSVRPQILPISLNSKNLAPGQ